MHLEQNTSANVWSYNGDIVHMEIAFLQDLFLGVNPKKVLDNANGIRISPI